jgi:hypothetical protein
VAFALMQVFALLTHTYTAGFRDLLLVRMSDAELARELTESCLAHLRVRGAPRTTTRREA